MTRCHLESAPAHLRPHSPQVSEKEHQMADRVDKAWQTKGLGSYSTEAILGTLRHYGVDHDEGSFKTLAGAKFPLELSTEWQPRWKGTGQFARFHWAAADELTRRLFPERLMPGEFARGLHGLLAALARLNGGAADAPVGTEFKKVAALQARVPLEQGKAHPSFVTEVRLRLGDELMKVFGSMAQELAKRGHVDDAEEFARLEEFLFPQWAGVSLALVRAAKGEKAQALADLGALLKDPNRDGPSKAAAVDALIHLEALPQARDAALEVLDLAEREDDLHLALEMGQRAVYLMDKLQDSAGLAVTIPRVERLHERHGREHQH